MALSRAFAWLLAAAFLLAGFLAHGGIEPLEDQYIPSGKTLVVPIPATDPAGPARSYTVTVGAPTTSGTTTTAAGIVAAIRTGDPHLFIGVTYTDSNSLIQTGTMEFQLLREFSPITTQIIGGLAQGGFYNPLTDGTTSYITFFRVLPGFLIQGGDPNNDGTGGPGFTFENEFSSALIFSATAGQLAMANAGTNYNGGTNGSDFFITVAPQRSLDYGFSIFGQLLRGYGTLNGIAGTPLQWNQRYNELSSPVSPVNITSASVSSNDTDAVLLLSATGVCDSVITVTASSAGSTSVQSFTAHAVSDSTSDPPFLQPVRDIVASDGAFKLPLRGTDLQLDLSSYGYQRLYPNMDTSVTSGTSPLLALPLVSNTDNAIAASVEHWNPPYTLYQPDTRIFHVAAGGKSLIGSLTPIPLGHDGSLVLDRVPIALFSTDKLSDTAAAFTATVNWGDGTFLSGTDLSIVRPSPLANRFRLIASHTYQTPGEFPVIVNIADPGGAHLTLTGAANIGPSDIAIAAKDVSTVNGRLAGRIAGFVDYGSHSIPSDYSATINWGDGSVSPGVVRRVVGSSYEILGAHAYRTSGTFTLSTSVSRTGVSGDSASTSATASIFGIKSPQVFPPFPQAHLAQVWTSLETDSNSVVISSTDGGNPQSGLVQGTDGNLYGVTNAGGAGWGTVFEITTTGSLGILHTFTGGDDGGLPYGPLVKASDGNLYGTSSYAGTGGYGTVFQISTSGSFSTLYSFADGEDGASPYGGLIQGTDGNLYGTTSYSNGVINVGEGFGSIFKITASGSLTTLAYFNFSNGSYPQTALVQGTDGYFYGTTTGGGTHGFGTVFQYIPGGSITTLHSFSYGDDGANPFGSLIQGADGSLYGTTETGGSNGGGTVFYINSVGWFGVAYPFSGADGSAPYAPLITGTDGNFYGTTETGGANNDGTVFCLTPGGSLTTLYSFAGPDGNAPQGGLIQATDGNFYGTTSRGGSSGDGTVFRLTPGGLLTTLHSFDDTELQYYVQATVTIVNSGNVTSQPGSFSAYVDPNGALDGQQTILTCGTQSSFAIPPLAPGASYSFEFAGAPYVALSGRVTPAEATTVITVSLPYPLQLPAGFDPTGQPIIGVVTYSDPVGDFDGSQKIVSPGSF